MSLCAEEKRNTEEELRGTSVDRLQQRTWRPVKRIRASDTIGWNNDGPQRHKASSMGRRHAHTDRRSSDGHLNRSRRRCVVVGRAVRATECAVSCSIVVVIISVDLVAAPFFARGSRSNAAVSFGLASDVRSRLYWIQATTPPAVFDSIQAPVPL